MDNLFVSIPHSPYLTVSNRHDPVHTPVTIRRKSPNPETRNPKPGTRDPKPETRIPKAGMCLRSRCRWTTSLSSSSYSSTSRFQSHSLWGYNPVFWGYNPVQDDQSLLAHGVVSPDPPGCAWWAQRVSFPRKSAGSWWSHLIVRNSLEVNCVMQVDF